MVNLLNELNGKRKALLLIAAACVLGVGLLAGAMWALMPDVVKVSTQAYADAWGNSNFAYRIPLLFKPFGSHTGRVLVRLSESGNNQGEAVIDYDNFNADGEGILFMTAAGVTIPHHIALWDTGSTSHIWISTTLPWVASLDPDVYMYYSMTTASDYEDIAGVWAGYEAVWLLDETDQVWRDYHDYDNDPYGNFATPDKMGYIAYEAQDFNCPSPGGGGWWGFYSSEEDRTILAYSGGDEEYYAHEGSEYTPGWYCPCDGFITYYDHATSSWATPFKLFESAAEVHDAHNYPMILLGDDGYLHSFYAEHATTSVSYTKSTYPLTHTSWTLDGWEVGTSWGLSATYIYPIVNSEGDMYIFYRKTLETDNVNGSANWYEPQYMLKTSDNGENFVESKICDPSPDESTQLWNTTYWTYAGIQYTTTPSEGIHVTWDIHGGHNWYMSTTHYAFLSLIDQNGWTEDTWYAADGTNLGATVDYTEQHGSKVQLWAYDEVISHTNTGRGFGMCWDDDGHPNLFTTHRQNEATDPYFQLEWWVHDGTNWVTSTTNIDAYDTTDAIVPTYVEYNSASDIDLYAEARESMSAYDAWTVSTTRAYQGKWHYDGSNWALEEIVWGKNENATTNFMGFGPIMNAHNDLQYIIAGRNWLSGGQLEEAGWVYPKERGEIFGWGDQGILKQSTSEESTSPVGMGWHLDGSEDNIFVNHYNVGGASDFTFDSDIVCVEALVKFDQLSSDLGNQQFILGKSQGNTGFSLRQSATDNIEWYVGDGAAYTIQVFPHGQDGKLSLEANTWYYIVAFFLADAGPGHDALFTFIGNEDTWDDDAIAVNLTPDWGTAPLRIGASSTAADLLDGSVGGYISIRDDKPSWPYIKNSWKNFIDQALVEYEEIQPRTAGCEYNFFGDGLIDVNEIMLIAGCWNVSCDASSTNSCCTNAGNCRTELGTALYCYDLDGSGGANPVSVVDIMLVSAKWGTTCN